MQKIRVANYMLRLFLNIPEMWSYTVEESKQNPSNHFLQEKVKTW